MKRTRLVALAAVLCAGVAAPASAAWDRIGTVNFTPRPDHETTYGTFGGRVEALSLRARAPVQCNDVRATFGNGMTRTLYRGTLRPGRETVMDLPGPARLIRRIDFDCRSLIPRMATVDIAADVGRYQAEWRASPDWERMWSRMFNWGDRYGDNRYDNRYGNDRYGNDRYVEGPLDTQGWFNVGRETFEGYYDRETTITGLRGRSLSRIGLRPTNDDARCSRVTATFADGRRLDLNIDDRQVLREDRITQIDLPGYRSDVMRLDMSCHAEHGNQVTMLVMADR